MFQQYGQAGYAWDPKMATTPGPQVDLRALTKPLPKPPAYRITSRSIRNKLASALLDLRALTNPLPKPASIPRQKSRKHAFGLLMSCSRPCTFNLMPAT